MKTHWCAQRSNSVRSFCSRRSDRMYSVEIFWVVMIDGNYSKTGLLHALSQLSKASAPGGQRTECDACGEPPADAAVRTNRRAIGSALATEDSEFEWAAQRPHAGRAARGGEDLPACPASREFPPLQKSGGAAARAALPRLAVVRFGAGGPSWLSPAWTTIISAS